jgi:hypothetical protein
MKFTQQCNHAQNRRIASFSLPNENRHRYPETTSIGVWDIDDIVKFIGNTMNKNEELALDVLQRKSITLIVIATMWRHGQTLVESNYKISIYPETNKDEAIGVSYS